MASAEKYVVRREGNEVIVAILSDPDGEYTQIWKGSVRGFNRTALSEYLGIRADGRKSRPHDSSWVTVDKEKWDQTAYGGHAEHRWYIEARIPKPQYP